MTLYGLPPVASLEIKLHLAVLLKNNGTPPSTGYRPQFYAGNKKGYVIPRSLKQLTLQTHSEAIEASDAHPRVEPGVASDDSPTQIRDCHSRRSTVETGCDPVRR